MKQDKREMLTSLFFFLCENLLEWKVPIHIKGETK